MGTKLDGFKAQTKAEVVAIAHDYNLGRDDLKAILRRLDLGKVPRDYDR